MFGRKQEKTLIWQYIRKNILRTVGTYNLLSMRTGSILQLKAGTTTPQEIPKIHLRVPDL